jgi:hypothetical protein
MRAITVALTGGGPLRVSKRALIAVAVGISVGLSGAIAGSAHAAASVPRAVARPAATGYSAVGALNGVAAASNSDAWAVGSAGSKILMLHWNGKAWSRITRPGALTAAGQLKSITVVNAKDAWAVGSAGTKSLLLHWNGKAWSQVTRPAPVVGSLNSVAATASGGWAVGDVSTGHDLPPKPLILRLSGATAARASLKNDPTLTLTGAAITGKSAAWVIGATEQQFEFGRWNGHTWTWEPVLSIQDLYELNGIAAGPGGTAFTVGYVYPDGGRGAPVALKLTGSTWKKVSVPADANLEAVAFAPGGTAWAGGSLMLRWNGTAWKPVSVPSLKSVDRIGGLGFSAANYGWAVGGAGARTLILHWNGRAWK